MNNFTSRPCELQQDHQKIRDFWLDCRAASDVRCYPTIWRILLLLTSRVNNPEKDTRIWEDASGQIAAFAMLWRRQTTSPYIVLDCFANPSFVTEDLLLEILRWGDQRTHALSGEQKSELTVIANGFSQYGFGDGLLRQLDFTPVIPDANEHNVYFAKSLNPEIPAPSLPIGYIIRRLRDATDVEAYQSLYGFATVNTNHQLSLLQSDEYCYLVMVNPDGEFVAYCECSIWRAEWDRTGHRIGWIDYVETRPGQQKQGFGQAILLAGLSS